MIESIRAFVKMVKTDWATSICALVFGATSLIVGQPAVISFLPDAMEITVVQISEFVQKLSVVMGFVFASQTKPNELLKKDVIPEVLKTNQPEGKETLMSGVEPKEQVPPSPKKKARKPPAKKAPIKSTKTTKPKTKP